MFGKDTPANLVHSKVHAGSTTSMTHRNHLPKQTSLHVEYTPTREHIARPQIAALDIVWYPVFTTRSKNSDLTITSPSKPEQAYASLATTETPTPIVLAVIPISRHNTRGPELCQRVELVRALLARLPSTTQINRLLLGSRFHSEEILTELTDRDIQYSIPTPRDTAHQEPVPVDNSPTAMEPR